MTREDLLADRTIEPLMSDAAFHELLRTLWAEVQAECQVRRKAKCSRPAKHRDLFSDDCADMLTGADAAELLSGLGG